MSEDLDRHEERFLASREAFRRSAEAAEKRQAAASDDALTPADREAESLARVAAAVLHAEEEQLPPPARGDDSRGIMRTPRRTRSHRPEGDA